MPTQTITRADYTDITKDFGNRVLVDEVTTPEIDPADTVVLEDLDPGSTHTFVSVLLEDASGDPLLAGAGSFAVEVKTRNNHFFEPITDGPTIDATAPTTSSTHCNVEKIRITPTGVTVIDHYRVRVTHNKT